MRHREQPMRKVERLVLRALQDGLPINVWSSTRPALRNGFGLTVCECAGSARK